MPPKKDQPETEKEKEIPEAEEEAVEVEATSVLLETEETPALVTESKSKSSFKTYFWITLLVAFLVTLVGGGIFVYYRTLSQKQVFTSETPALPSLTPSPTEAPSASPAAELKREDLAVKVLNGRGVSGTAGEAKKFLEDLGYADVAVGNADSYDYEQTVVQIKESKKDYLSLLLDDLSSDYRLSEESETLPEDEDFDVLVIIGQE